MCIIFLTSCAVSFIHSFVRSFVSCLECGGTLHNTNGEIKSPNYPDSYRDESDCLWTGKLPEQGIVSITIKEFDIPASVNCTNDKLIVQNGKHSDSPIVATLCGNHSDLAHRTFTLSGSYFRVHLTSSRNNGIVSRRRFKITYTTLQSGQSFIYYLPPNIP